MSAPEEERKAIDEARARSLRAGRLVTTEELRRRLKLEKKILL